MHKVMKHVINLGKLLISRYSSAETMDITLDSRTFNALAGEIIDNNEEYLPNLLMFTIDSMKVRIKPKYISAISKRR